MSVMDKIFENRSEFVILAVTGRTGCGCTTAAEILEKKFRDLEIDTENSSVENENERRKDRIVATYLSKGNWKPFYYIKISDIITAYLLNEEWCDVEKYFQTTFPEKYEKIIDTKFIEKNFKAWKRRTTKIHKLLIPDVKRGDEKILDQLEKLTDYSEKIREELKSINFYSDLYQHLGDNIRKFGRAISPKGVEPDATHLYALIEVVNKIIKTIKDIKNEKGEFSNRRFILDAIRNPLEAVFFRERYSAFYVVSINATKEERIGRLQKNKYTLEAIQDIDKKEGGETESEKELKERRKDGEIIKKRDEYKVEIDKIVSQNIPICIEHADIHLHNSGIAGDPSRIELTRQLMRYVALITHPGIIPPTKDERIMQIAFSAKENSCCISRKVGAVVVSGSDKIAGIGWNDVPQGQTGCSLRNIDNLFTSSDPEAYSDYELKDETFRKSLSDNFSTDEFTNKTGLPRTYCFKALKNKGDGEKNQVHTRALHAEENAFLQTVKKGGISVERGTLFSTASPCELCAKKAYQLGIKRVVYIDPYPGISQAHIFECGEKRPMLDLFKGAVGASYFKLYSQILPYKDELEIRRMAYELELDKI
jgi:deoxycytidylate deaminase/dephospho-CoA kinase